MLELLIPTKTKLLECKTLSRKNRPADEKPGVKLFIEQQLPNTFLDHFDPALKALLYERAKGAKSAQASLEGVPEATDAPNLTNAGLKLGSISWHHDMTGYAVTVARGAGFSKAGTVNLADAILCNWKLTLKEGGTVIARYNIEAGNVPGDAWETFAELKSREFEMTAKAPAEAQRDMVAESEARELKKGIKASLAKARKPGANDRAAVAKVKGGKAEAPKGKTHAVATGTVSKEGAWPFPKGKKPDGEAPPQSATVESVTRSPAQSRTSRGRDATKAFLDRHAKDAAEADTSTAAGTDTQ